MKLALLSMIVVAGCVPPSQQGTYQPQPLAAHYLDPAGALRGFDPSHLEPALRGAVVADQDAIVGNLADELAPGSRKANGQELDEIVAFLQALTDPAAEDQAAIVPASVPSGLPVD